jgi:hypothetical protein
MARIIFEGMDVERSMQMLKDDAHIILQ